MNRQVVEITIDKKGNYTFEAKEGFHGKNCRQQTQTLEMAIGGVVVQSDNTKDYYDDGININLKL